jgi:hypothetical protein
MITRGRYTRSGVVPNCGRDSRNPVSPQYREEFNLEKLVDSHIRSEMMASAMDHLEKIRGIGGDLVVSSVWKVLHYAWSVPWACDAVYDSLLYYQFLFSGWERIK